MSLRVVVTSLSVVVGLVGCGAQQPDGPSTQPHDSTGKDPDAAAVVAVDRFQDGFATLFKRSAPVFDPAHVQPVVPAPDAPIDFDALFLVKAIGPGGELIDYYSFDIVSPVPQHGFFFSSADGTPVAGQLPVLDKVPGDVGYSDFVLVTQVTVGDSYVANTLTSVAEVQAAVQDGEVTVQETTRIENWAMVPKGTHSSRTFAGHAIPVERAWVGGDVAYAMTFEKNLEAVDGQVPTSGIVVIFKNDTDPSQGFATDAGGRTHNVLETLATDAAYSSLWFHARGGLAGFDTVVDYSTGVDNIAGDLPVSVNCPVLD